MPRKKKEDENSDPNNIKLVFKELNKLLIHLKKIQPHCPICLGHIETRCYLNKCLHSYCLQCVSEWSKTKLNCPSCGQKFVAVFYNVRSVRSYQIRDFVPKSKRSTCLLRSMNTINSYFEVKESLSRILSKHDLTFDLFHSKVVFLET
ncbi:hypothetical protein PGB90_008701 [Kerria lacca]